MFGKVFGLGTAIAAGYYLQNVAFPGASPDRRIAAAIPRRISFPLPRARDHNTHVAGKEAKDMSSEDILARYDRYYAGATDWGGAQPAHDDNNNAAATERYFTLITDFFEYGWGDAFHMAPLRPDWSFKRSMAYWEQNFVLTMGLKRDMRVADLGMGIGGPMRRVVEFTGANMTGVTICEHQINRAHAITAKLPQYVQDRTEYLRGDYNDLPAQMLPSTYDAAYFMESLSHSEDRASPLAQAAKIVKPGGIVAGWQWMLRPEFDYDNERHMDLKRGMEYGGGLRNLNKPDARIKEYERAGLEVLDCVETKSSTRLQCERIRTIWTRLFRCASRARRERSIRPKMSRIDFDLTELENSQVWFPHSPRR